MTTETLLVEMRNDVLWVTINRPEKRNALSRDVLADLLGVFTEQARNEALKMAVLTGSGDKNFAAGGDLRELMSVRSYQEAVEMATHTRQVMDKVRYFPVPVVAAINGDALGGGGELALAPDFRVAAAHARIAFVQGRLNVPTAWGGGIDLLRRVGYEKGLWMMGTREYVSGEEALRIGLFDAIAEQGTALEDRVEEFIAPFLQHIPRVLRSFKSLGVAVRQGLPQQELEELETRLLAASWITEDHWQAAGKVVDSMGSGGGSGSKK